MASWVVYIIQCADDTLYTGITTDMERRFKEHTSGEGAKYTRGRTPLKLVYTELCTSRSQASKREYEIKQLDRNEKIKLALH